MKAKKPNAELVWKQLEDQLAPRLRLSTTDRTVYAHLLRHSRLEGKLRLRFSILGLARDIRLTAVPVRKAVRRLAVHGVLRIAQDRQRPAPPRNQGRDCAGDLIYVVHEVD